MREIPLTVQHRGELGKSASHRTRREGLIPGILYGPEIKPVPVTVEERAFRLAMKEAHGSHILNITLDGKQTKAVLREMQRDPLSSKITHLDFHAISMNKPIHISIPIRCIGLAKGVKVDGGIMQQTMRELEITSLPANVPDEVVVDVTELGIGQSIHVGKLDLPNVNILEDPQQTIVVISAPTIIKAAVVEAAAEAAVAPAEGEEGAAAEGEKAEGEAKAEGDKKEKGKAEGEKKEKGKAEAEKKGKGD